jgi:hypothetical protein
MTGVAIAGWVVRLTGMAQVVLGLLFWFGHALPLVGAHMLNGMVFVLGVLVLVVAAARSGLGAPLVALATAYTLVVPAFGMTHARILPRSGSLGHRSGPPARGLRRDDPCGPAGRLRPAAALPRGGFGPPARRVCGRRRDLRAIVQSSRFSNQ